MSVTAKKHVGSLSREHELMRPTWQKCRVLCEGQEAVKALDKVLRSDFKNLLIPFSTSMDQQQYDFYMAEAELPGILSQFSKMLVGGLLRKKPLINFPKSCSEEVVNWITNEFSQDGLPITAFLDEALWEEVQTSYAWIFVDHPKILKTEGLSEEDLKSYKPYPVLYKAESVINTLVETNKFGRKQLSRVVIKESEKIFKEGEFHPEYRPVVYVHELNKDGFYVIRKFPSRTLTDSEKRVTLTTKLPPEEGIVFEEDLDALVMPIVRDEPLKFIPAWPLNGSFEIQQPLLQTLVEKEISLYNKLSRRNHLLYGASTYTPVVHSDMMPSDFEKIVGSGLGAWLQVGKEDRISVLETPTAALADMEKAIEAGFAEIGKLGVRMLTPETAQSGIALDLRNATQNAQIGTLSTKISNVMHQVILTMIQWHQDIEIKPGELLFELSSDFKTNKLDSQWLRLVTEWYENGLLPRSVWLSIAKDNEIVSSDYNDEIGKVEIMEDMNAKRESDTSYEETLQGAFSGNNKQP